ERFFHKSFVWFGERTRFEGVKTYAGYQPTQRVLLEGEAYILDVAPIVKGFTSDIGVSGCYGENKQHAQAIDFLRQMKSELTAGLMSPSVWSDMDEKIVAAGYDNIH
ncbi:MAG: aminopeptidase P family protein, partial [Gallionella sp.]|nr:aminopeptidase P family protein [Gallionella sp.]